MAGGIATKGTHWASGSVANNAADATKDRVGHAHEWNGHKERENLDGDAKNDANWLRCRGNNNEASKLRGAIKNAKHWVEEQHLEESAIPALEPLLCVWKHIGNKRERRNHDKDKDESLTGGHSDDGRDDGDEAGKKNWKKNPDDTTDAAKESRSSKDCDAGSTDAEHSGDDTRDGSSTSVFRNVAILDGDVLDINEEILEAVTEDIANIDSKRTDNIAEVDQDSGNNNARKNLFDTVIVDTVSGELRENDN